jgi:hypothetical protein
MFDEVLNAFPVETCTWVAQDRIEENAIKQIRHRRIPVKGLCLPDKAVYSRSMVLPAFFIVSLYLQVTCARGIHRRRVLFLSIEFLSCFSIPVPCFSIACYGSNSILLSTRYANRKRGKNKLQRRFPEIEEQKADVVVQDALVTKSEIAVDDIFW